MIRVIDNWSEVKHFQENAFMNGTDWVRKDLVRWQGTFVVTEDIQHHEITVRDLFCVSMTGLGGSDYRPDHGIVRVLGMTVSYPRPHVEGSPPWGSAWYCEGETDYGMRQVMCCLQGTPGCPCAPGHSSPFALTPSDPECPCWNSYRLPELGPACELTLPEGALIDLVMEVQKVSPEWGESHVTNGSSVSVVGQTYRGPLDWAGGGKIAPVTIYPMVMPERMSHLKFSFPACDSRLLVQYTSDADMRAYVGGASRVCSCEWTSVDRMRERFQSAVDHFMRRPYQQCVREGGEVEVVDCFGEPLPNYGPVPHA